MKTWPQTPDGEEMNLLAQIYLPELPEGLELPKSGALFSFYDCLAQAADYGESAQVIYTEEGLPPEPRHRSMSRKGYNDEYQSYVKAEQIMSHATDEAAISHQMRGYPQWIQSDDGLEKDRILLLQIDTDTVLNPQWLWGDAGRIFILISRQAIIDKDFDQIELPGECY